MGVIINIVYDVVIEENFMLLVRPSIKQLTPPTLYIIVENG